MKSNFLWSDVSLTPLTTYQLCKAVLQSRIGFASDTASGSASG
jgi:hypothetical protein